MQSIKSKTQEMTNVDYYYAVRELQELAGARLSNFYELAPGFFRVKLSSKQGERNLAIELGRRAHSTKYLHESPKQPTAFAAFLRRHLDNAVLAEITQTNLDRVLRLTFQKKERFFLIVEMLGVGNMVLCDADEKIICVYRKQEFAARKIAVGEKYSPPPMNKKNAGELSEADFAAAKEKERVVSFLSRAVNLPPRYLEEACARAGIALERKACGLSKEEARVLVKECGVLLKEAPAPRVFYSGGEPVGFAPFALKKLASEFKEFPSFSQALDEYYRTARAETRAGEKNAVFEKQLDKLAHSLEQQENAVKELEESAAEKQRGGAWINENAALVAALVEIVKGKRAEKAGEAEIGRALGKKANAVLEKQEIIVDAGAS